MYKDFNEAKEVRDKITQRYAIIGETYHEGQVCYLI